MSKSQVISELHKPARKNYPRRRVITKGLDDLWQADLVEMIRENKGCKYLLTAIDVFSKFGWAAPQKSKSAENVVAAFHKIFKGGRVPKNIQTDNGKEFYNMKFKNLMKKYELNHYSTYSNLKASVVVRFNRTLKSLMWREFSLRGNYKWITFLSDLLRTYNESKHRTTRMRPVDVTKDKEKLLLDTVYSNIKIVGPAKFKPGDFVRISKIKLTFEKGYVPNWSQRFSRLSRCKLLIRSLTSWKT